MDSVRQRRVTIHNTFRLVSGKSKQMIGWDSLRYIPKTESNIDQPEKLAHPKTRDRDSQELHFKSSGLGKWKATWLLAVTLQRRLGGEAEANLSQLDRGHQEVIGEAQSG